MNNNQFSIYKVNDSGLIIQVEPAVAFPEEDCYLAGIEVKDLLGCSDSFLKFCRDNDLVDYYKLDTEYLYNLFTFKSITDVFRKKIRWYCGIDK